MSIEDTAEEMNGHLIDGAAEKVQWGRAMATEFLEYADQLEDRAEKFRHLAALMILEAQNYASEVSTLLSAEFPTDASFEAVINGEQEDEGLGSEE